MMNDKLIWYKEGNGNDAFDYELDDLILRRDAMNAVENEDNLHNAMDSVWDGTFRRTKRAAVRVIAGVHAVLPEMSAREYGRMREQICHQYQDECWDCPFYYSKYCHFDDIDERTISKVEKWAQEHPDRSVNDENS